MKTLEGKTVLVTGASRGIGRAVALRLARAGGRIVIAATSVERLAEVKGEIEAEGAEVLASRCDVSRLAECEALAQASLERFGAVDVLVNNAGVGYSGSVVESDPEEVERMVRVNVLGLYYMTHSVLPSMIERGRGDVVNVGSVAAIKYSPNFAVYSATKFAVRAFSEALRNEVQGHGIRVTLVHPGLTKTDFFDSFARRGSPVPLDKGEILRPEEIAEAVLYALARPEGVSLNEVTVRPVWQER
jgi:NADP-dependent 3-hydroxy acid dehydrogenase YdfG